MLSFSGLEEAIKELPSLELLDDLPTTCKG